MKRRTLDVMFSVGGLIVAALLLLMGVVLKSNSDFAQNYTRYQLAAEGRTYASQGDFVNGLKAQLAAAQTATPPDQAQIADLNARITSANAARETLFKGETLRGLLLTSYGFSVFGVKGGQAANVAYGVGGLMLLLSLAGLFHAWKTPATKPFAAPEPAVNGSQKVLVNA